MKKLIGLVFLICTLALALNFSGNQSLNGLQTTKIFTAPGTGYYFVNGQLTLPQLYTTGGSYASQVVATVSKNSATLLYTGLAGATGFQINQISLVTGDYVSVNLASTSASPISQDGVLNSVRGQVSYGNTF